MKAGDLVRLKSGGPLMTVNSTYDGVANCAWFDHSDLQTGAFSFSSLEVDETMKPKHVTLVKPPNK